MLNILIIEDEEQIRKEIRRIVSAPGIHVDEAEDGSSAIMKINNNRYDLVILDLVLPNVDGMDVLREIRDNEEMSELPVVILSSKNKDEDVFEGYRNKTNYYITKPFTEDQLIKGIELIFGEGAIRKS
ncbi:MAG: response regulator [Candidatus Eremiobacteraeota bacterium]|nr:response regulator [Candidatus Eremiobacteraeota bacterium]